MVRTQLGDELVEHQGEGLKHLHVHVQETKYKRSVHTNRVHNFTPLTYMRIIQCTST